MHDKFVVSFAYGLDGSVNYTLFNVPLVTLMDGVPTSGDYHTKRVTGFLRYNCIQFYYYEAINAVQLWNFSYSMFQDLFNLPSLVSFTT